MTLETKERQLEKLIKLQEKRKEKVEKLIEKIKELIELDLKTILNKLTLAKEKELIG